MAIRSIGIPTIVKVNNSYRFTTTITTDGALTNTSFGIVWSISQSSIQKLPDFVDTRSDTIAYFPAGKTSHVFYLDIPLSFFELSATYYIKAFYMADLLTIYSAMTNFQTEMGGLILLDEIELDDVEVSDIKDTRAIVSSTILNLNGATAKEHGFVYSTIADPTISGLKVNLGTKSTAASFGVELTDLNRNTNYFIRAYAITQDDAISYGPLATVFQTLSGIPLFGENQANRITSSSFSVSGSITSFQGGIAMKHGHVWGTSPSPTRSTGTPYTDLGYRGLVGEFVSTLQGLSENTKYYVRAYVENEAGISYSSETIFVTFPLPKIQIKKAVFLGGKIELEGYLDTGNNLSEAGFVWSTSKNDPTVSDSKRYAANTTTSQNIKATIRNPVKGATYFIRAYAKNAAGLVYSNTLTVIIPTQIIPARLKNGELYLMGEVSERLPAVTDGLVAHYPFDDTEKGISINKNSLNTSQWELGTEGTQGKFSRNGTDAENQIILYENPWGNEEATWATLVNDAAANADGGWNHYNVPIDHTKKYRLSVWVKRVNAGNGRTYFGCQASTVCNLNNNTVNTNPYFGNWVISQAPELQDNWILMVAYIHPSTYSLTTSDPTNGMYKLDGTRTRGMTDFKWEPGKTIGGHRAYLYNSTSTTEEQYFVRPRMEVCDGTEPSIHDLLNGFDDMITPKSYSNTTLTEHGIAIEESTTNLITNGNFSNGVTGWRLNGGKGNATIYTTVMDEKTCLYQDVGNWNQTDYRSYSINLLANTTYTVSFLVYRIEGTIIFDPNGPWNTSYNLTPKIKEWVKYSYTFTTGGTGGNEDFNFYANANRAKYYLTHLQLEQKSFATSFVNGARNGNGSVSIPVSIDSETQPFTLNFWIAPNKDGATGSTGNKSISLNNFGSFWRHLPTGSDQRKFIWDYVASTRTYGDFQSAIPFVENQYEMITITWDLSNTRIYRNGVLGLTRISTADCTLGFIDEIKMLNLNASIKDLSLYKRILSVDEMQKLHKRSFSITSNGDLETPNLIESLVVPKDIIHIPLGFNGESTSKEIQPLVESNAIYEEDAVWIGSATTNYAQYNCSAYASYYTYSRNGNSHFCYRHAGSSSMTVALQCPTFQSNIGAGEVYTISGYLYLNGVPFKTTVPHISTYHTGTSSRISRDDGYFAYTQSFVSGSWIIHSNLCNAAIGDTVEIRNLQIEKKNHASPFTERERGAGEIVYDSPMINVSQANWTIFGFYNKYNYANHSYFLDKLGHLDLHIGNWDGEAFAPYWSSPNGASNWTTPQHERVVRKWKFFAMARSGNLVHLYDGMDGVLYSGTDVRGDFFNGHGVTGWRFASDLLSPTSGFNGYLRDFGFVQKTLSPEEIYAIYNTQMRAKGDSLQVQNLIKENGI